MQGILKEVDAIINKKLCVNNFSTRTSCQDRSKVPLPNLDGCALIESVYGKIHDNWNKKPSRSQENWRWKPNTKLPGSTIEVQIERELVRKSGGAWINQVPASSGLTNGRADTRLAIDLVRWCEDGWYEFIELKAESNTPLYAAMEILQYGILYIFSRIHRDKLGYRPHKNPLLWGEGVRLKVLAPDNYYKYKERGKKDLKPYELEWLEKMINKGLCAFLPEPKRDFGMTFSFESFANKEDLLKDPLSNRNPFYPISS